MALDATIAGASADSYLTVDDADALAADDLGPEADRWLDPNTTEERRESVLRRATREIDAWVRSGIPRWSATQRRQFPRSIDVRDGEPYIHEDIRQATYLQAAFVLSNAAVIDRAGTRSARNMSQAAESGLQYSAPTDDQGSSVMSPRALHFLAGFPSARRSSRSGTVQSSRIASGFPGASW